MDKQPIPIGNPSPEPIPIRPGKPKPNGLWDKIKEAGKKILEGIGTGIGEAGDNR